MPKFYMFIFIFGQKPQQTNLQTNKTAGETRHLLTERYISENHFAYSAFDKQLPGIICELKTYIESA